MNIDKYEKIKAINEDIDIIKKYSYLELNELSKEIRELLIHTLSRVGGHLSSNLAVVELTIALFKVFDSPKDKFIWDIGHQSYVHKILTGRAGKLHKIRKFNGISGFIKRTESKHDIWEAGHASTSLSASLGIELSNLLNNHDEKIISIIGDGALTGGMALEALNNIGHLKTNNIIILNDNNMSISKNVGALQNHINNLRIKSNYLPLKLKIREKLIRNKIGFIIYKKLKFIKNSFKNIIIGSKGNFFTSLGLEYIGPIDGHNINKIEDALIYAKGLKKPVVIHMITKKGKGFLPAEKDNNGEWHGVEKFSIKDGLLKNNSKTWSEIISTIILSFMKKDKSIVVITPAMISGSKLENIKKDFPDRIFDTGISEEHAMTFAAGLSIKKNIKPFLSIYSTFFQRSYDQLIHDIARQNLPVIIGMDRCGFANGDGETHHGIYDISITMHIPNLVICMGRNIKQTKKLIYNALYKYNKPIIIRYPRGYINESSINIKCNDYKNIELGKWEKLINNNSNFVIISYGSMIQSSINIINKLKKKVGIDLVNATFLKPLDESLLLSLKKYKRIFIIEETSEIGGLGMIITHFFAKNNIIIPINIFAIKDKIYPHGDRNNLLQLAGLDEHSLYQNIVKLSSNN